MYLWENGHIVRYFKNNNELKREEYMYLHLQKRKMKNFVDNQVSIIKIVPNSFLPFGFDKVTVDNFVKIKKKDINSHFLRIKIFPRLQQLRKKLGI